MRPPPGPICEVWECQRAGIPVPSLRNWPDPRGAQLCTAHRVEARRAQAAGLEAYRAWLMQFVC